MNSSPTIARARFDEGPRWLFAGAELLARGGPAMLRVALVLLVVSLLQLVPAVGPLLLLLVSPAITAGVLNVYARIERGEPVLPSTVLAGLARPDRRARLLFLGAVLMFGAFAALAALSAWLAPQMDIQALTALLNDPETMNAHPERLFALFDGVNVFGGVLIAGVIGAGVLGALYFAVPLVFFWGWPVLAALLWSLRAVLVNWAAFLGFGLVAVGVLLAIGLVIGLFGSILSLALGSMAAPVVQLLTVIASLFVQLLVAAAQWRAFLRVFPAEGDPGRADGGVTEV